MNNLEFTEQSEKSSALMIASRWLRKMAGYAIFSNETKQLLNESETNRYDKEVKILVVRDAMIDPERNLIYVEDNCKKIKPALMNLLLCLIRHRGQVVSKETLKKEAWPSKGINNSEITVLMAQLRETFKDQAKKPRYIETAGHQGYCFVAPVEELFFGVYAYKKQTAGVKCQN